MNLAALQHSAFLQSLGWAIANSIWQAGLFLFLYHLVVSSYNNASSKFKNNLGTVFLFSSFLWFTITFFNKFIYLQNETPKVAPKQLIYSTNFNSISANFNLQSFTYAISTTLPYLSVAYLLLLLIFSVKLVNSYRNTIFMRNNGLQKPNVEWRLFIKKVAGHMGFTKKIKLWFSEYVDVPATIGFLKPVILIPLASLNQLTPEQLEAIILHELSHIKRNDYLINLFISLIETILFFNPFIVLLSKIIKKERENCCDDFVLQYQYDRHSYASALLSLEKYRVQNLDLVLTATSGKKQLLFRIKRIMEIKSNNNSLNYGQKLLALILITGIICSIAWLSPAKRSSNQSYNSKHLQTKKSAGIKHEVNKEGNSFLSSRDEATINSIIPPKFLKDKRIILTDILRKNNVPGKKEDPLFAWKLSDDQMENNLELIDAYDNREVRSPDISKEPTIFIGPDNFFFMPDLTLKDFNLGRDLNFNIDANKLRTEIEKSRQSFSFVDWDNVQHEIIESLAKINLGALKIKFGKKQITPDTDDLKRDKEIRKKFQFNFINENKSNTPTWNITIGQNDSLPKKDIHSSDHNDRKTFYIRNERNNFPIPPISPNTFTSSFPVRPSEDDLEVNCYSAGKKLPKKTVHINYENGSVIINGEKLNLSKFDNHEGQAIVKKLLLDISKQVVEVQTEN